MDTTTSRSPTPRFRPGVPRIRGYDFGWATAIPRRSSGCRGHGTASGLVTHGVAATRPAGSRLSHPDQGGWQLSAFPRRSSVGQP
jgi:hypothetical protein